MMFQSAVCPCCGQIDAVRKVSAVVNEGTIHTKQLGMAPSLTGSDFFLVGLQGSSVTSLAQRLTPQPQRPGGIGLRVFLAAVAFFLGSTMACGLSIFAVTPEFSMLACGNWTLGIVLISAVLVVLPLSGIPQIGRKQAEYDRMMDQARYRWDRLYYCLRDDVTFNLDHGFVIPVHELSSYLYTKAGV